MIAPAFTFSNPISPANTYYGPYMLEIYDLGVTQRALGVDDQTCNSDKSVCTGGTMRYSEDYGIKASNLCVNNRCFNDPRFEEFWHDGYATNETHVVSVGNNPTSKNLLQAGLFRADNRSGSTTKWKLDQIGTFIHQHDRRQHSSGRHPRQHQQRARGDKLFDLETLRNDDEHIDYFLAPRDAPALEPNTLYYVIFSEGGTGSYKLYVTAKPGEDDDRHPNWPIDNAGLTEGDDDTPDPGTTGWDAMRKDDTMSGTPVLPQIEVYAGFAP